MNEELNNSQEYSPLLWILQEDVCLGNIWLACSIEGAPLTPIPMGQKITVVQSSCCVGSKLGWLVK